LTLGDYLAPFVNNSVAKRATMTATTPLDDAGILLHIFNILGPGHHLFVSAVSTPWRESYKNVASAKLTGLFDGPYERSMLHTISSGMTLCSAAFASAESVKMAHESGLAFDSERVQRIAGREANIPTLRVAHGLGLAFTDAVLIGAAEAASIPKLNWLHRDLPVSCR
jgi:hypothetical protein